MDMVLKELTDLNLSCASYVHGTCTSVMSSPGQCLIK